MTAPARRIVFLGTHGQYNIGDELLLETFLTELGPQHRYVVNSYDPAFTRAQLAERFAVTVIDTATERGRLLRALRSGDVLCFGGGSIVKELYASTGRHRWSTLLMILAIVTYTRLVARKPIAMLNVGVGPVRSAGGRRLARMILSQVDELTVRDERSLRLCQELGVPARAVTDAVFSVDPGSLVGGAPPPARPVDGPVRVALNLNIDVENPANWESFLAGLAQALTVLHARQPIEIHTLPMQTGFKEHDDADVLAGFAVRLPGIPVVRHDPRSPGDVAAIIGDCDVVVSERLHAIVLASILGVPAFALVYDQKVAELAAMLRMEQWSVDINAPFDADALADRLGDLVRDRDEVARQFLQVSGALRDRARGEFERARRWVAGTPSGGSDQADSGPVLVNGAASSRPEVSTAR
ncbi:hypothetical protein FDO65_08950 [Nakamurella flava]|uniref:Polysaccharide pyruvyl transferase domain-containing protein n=1 Tax=Nakamurella flava TaxID=2576308 RepID=A0A4U6QM64_9ACTN|nr:polysaccharide pyruvyl transferase family protein [Nakamurella flava]TKV61663.1 hypothetical protein FDO65_08950 [Nakamurella flava]